MRSKTETRDYWRQAAARWRAHGAFVRQATAPVSDALIAAGAPRPGETWVDIAGGVGDPAERLVEAVGVDGRVVVTDLVPDMVRAARDAVGAAPRVSFAAATAEALPLRQVADGVTCRFGAMFFGDPARAASEITATLTDGGRAVFAVWEEVDANPFFASINAAVHEVIPDFPDPEPDEPHLFRFAPPGKLAAHFASAGCEIAADDALDFTMAAPIGHRRIWDQMTSLSVELATLIEESGPEVGPAMRAIYDARMAPYFVDGSLACPARARIVVARKT